MNRINRKSQERIIALRKTGHSILEIVAITGIAQSTVRRYVLGVEVPEEHRMALRQKQGGAKDRAEGRRASVRAEIIPMLGSVATRDLFFLLIGIYWGEGTKKDLSLINSDPRLIQTFIRCLIEIGITRSRITLSLRVHKDIPLDRAKKFWSEATGLSEDRITRIEVIEGKKKGKLPFGMCRVRVSSGIRERLRIQTAISIVGAESERWLISPGRSRRSMDRTEVS